MRIAAHMDETKRLLIEADTQSDDAENQSMKQTRTQTRLSSFFTVVLPSLLLISIASNILQALQPSARNERLTIFPGLKHLKEETRFKYPEHSAIYGAFEGPPNNETAAAWNNLLQPFYFNVSSEELLEADVSPSTAVKVKGGGFLASLGVYHELHCLNQMRNLLYAQPRSSQAHLDHCIEVLRLSVMCSADVSLYTFKWPEEERFTHLDAHSKSARKCVDWSQLEKWSMERKISLTPTVLVPEVGNPKVHR